MQISSLTNNSRPGTQQRKVKVFLPSGPMAKRPWPHHRSTVATKDKNKNKTRSHQTRCCCSNQTAERRAGHLHRRLCIRRKQGWKRGCSIVTRGDPSHPVVLETMMKRGAAITSLYDEEARAMNIAIDYLSTSAIGLNANRTAIVTDSRSLCAALFGTDTEQ